MYFFPTVTVPTFQIPPERPTSAMLLDEIDVEDVLTSLLGLPANNSRPGATANDETQPISLPHMQLNEHPAVLPQIEIPGTNATNPVTIPTFPAAISNKIDAQNTQQLHVEAVERRHSEGDTHQRRKPSDPTILVGHTRKLSLDSYESKNSEVVRCRYPRCDNTTTPAEAKKTYKSCHNCSHLYCSRECRRSHWEKHRKACLHSRVSALCRQVLSACKDDSDTLRHLSLLARRGFLSQGRGVIRILFRSPENAELFIKQGFQCLGEVMYVRWPDLMPAEMGPELYSELLRLSTEYKPESKMLLYVAICVVSEAPTANTGQVKWERQLVSRCAKLKLCKSIINDMAHQKPIFEQQLQSAITNPGTSNSSSNTSTTTPNISAPDSDVLILKFSLSGKRNTQKYRELILQNIQSVLRQKGVSMRKNFPEVFQRLSSYVEGTADKFVPVTIHPRDTTTGRGFVCIIMPVTNENDVKIPTSSDSGSKVTIIDVGLDSLTGFPQKHGSDVILLNKIISREQG
uniref:CSON007221 protein n=1 Tax=Culicoides sonorensis TaxID=179676 RepID=A0A336KER9_CULSO